MNANHQHKLPWSHALLLSAGAIAAFHVAYSTAQLSFAIVLFLFCLFQLRGLDTGRKAFYFGLTIGVAIYAPQLPFFFKIFSYGAVALWLVLAFWIALFLFLIHHCAMRFSALTTAVLIPFVWTGIEYFRSELYYLRFSWLNVGFSFQEHFASIGSLFGVYGVGFALAALASAACFLNARKRTGFIAVATVPLLLLTNAPIDVQPYSRTNNAPEIAGVQLEFPMERDVLDALDGVISTNPAVQLIVLSEYTFQTPVPQKVLDWCRTNQRYVVVGAQQPTESNFYNTAFVVGPKGDIVFQQVKSVPIQFFKDGLPAPTQKLWESPWGKIGICICYDLSYRRVVDELVRQGAQALIVPTMDVIDWGAKQHQLHGRVAPVRAAEYGIPLYRVCSSGISQFVDANGHVRATAPFPGQGETLIGPLLVKATAGRLPIDYWLAPFCVLVTSGASLGLITLKIRDRFKTK